MSTSQSDFALACMLMTNKLVKERGMPEPIAQVIAPNIIMEKLEELTLKREQAIEDYKAFLEIHLN